VNKTMEAGTVDSNVCRVRRATRPPVILVNRRTPPTPPPSPQSGQIFHKLLGKNVEVKRAFTREQMREQAATEPDAAPMAADAADTRSAAAPAAYDPAFALAAQAAFQAGSAYAAATGGAANFMHAGGAPGGGSNAWTSNPGLLAQKLAAPAAYAGRAAPSFQPAAPGGANLESSIARSPSAVILVPGGAEKAQTKAGVRLSILLRATWERRHKANPVRLLVQSQSPVLSSRRRR
jgi:hypothetical protein